MLIHLDMAAAPQGSKRHVGHGVMIESCKRLPAYRKAMKAAAIEAKGTIPQFEGPVRVHATFVFLRPNSHKKDSWPTTRSSGDIDKLLRATFDAITDSGIWGDDSQVTRVAANKVYGDSAYVEVFVSQDVAF